MSLMGLIMLLITNIAASAEMTAVIASISRSGFKMLIICARNEL